VTWTNAFTDKLNDILFGRQPVSTYDELVKEWRASGGDTIRAEYKRAFQQAKA
jgi:putative aldouronate transport system substrate-binding protein